MHHIASEKTRDVRRRPACCLPIEKAWHWFSATIRIKARKLRKGTKQQSLRRKKNTAASRRAKADDGRFPTELPAGELASG